MYAHDYCVYCVHAVATAKRQIYNNRTVSKKRKGVYCVSFVRRKFRLNLEFRRYHTPNQIDYIWKEFYNNVWQAFKQACPLRPVLRMPCPW